ncbi:MAG: four-carbon acid sugar kinase family protein [Planctomycetota bacterium]
MIDPLLSEQKLPSESGIDWLSSIATHLKSSGRQVVVLDDDPTGTQTVVDVPVLTQWSAEVLADEFKREGNVAFVLTNSRALPRPEAIELARQIGASISEASQRVGREVTVISRGDSTLRGHFPAEVDALATALGIDHAVRTIVPYFLQGGRFTIDNVHYVMDGDRMIPAAKTPFASDATFGFQSSNLVDWVIERCEGNVTVEQIHTVGLDQLRATDPSPLIDRLRSIPPRHVCVVNAVTMGDVRTFVWAAMQAERAGQTWLHRTAASFVQAYAGLDSQPLLNGEAMIDRSASSGLIVVGSHVAKTRAQLSRLMEGAPDLQVVELDAEQVLGASCDDHIRDVVRRLDEHLRAGRHALLKTSDRLITGEDAESSLRMSVRISDAVVAVVRGIPSRLRFLIAKGGITSSDVATAALDVRRANVMGQILPGVPVWQLGDESRRPGMAYVVFPGNVGDDNALLRAYEVLTSSQACS